MRAKKNSKFEKRIAELDREPLTVDADGFAEFEITGKKILTIKFIG